MSKKITMPEAIAVVAILAFTGTLVWLLGPWALFALLLLVGLDENI